MSVAFNWGQCGSSLARLYCPHGCSASVYRSSGATTQPAAPTRNVVSTSRITRSQANSALISIPMRDPDEPITFREAQNSLGSNKWESAIQKRLDTLEEGNPLIITKPSINACDMRRYGQQMGPQNHYGFAINTPTEMSLTQGPSATTDSSQYPPPLPFSSNMEFGYSDPGNFTTEINQCSNRTTYSHSVTSPPSYSTDNYLWNSEAISHQIFDFTRPSLSNVATTEDLDSICGLFNFLAANSTAPVLSLIGSTNGQYFLPCVQGVEDASSTREPSYSQTVEHWARPRQELAASNTRRSSRDGVKFCKEAKPLPPICISDTNDALAMKRARNTLAARKSRQRKTARFEALEKRNAELEVERDRWKEIALSGTIKSNKTHCRKAVD